MWARGYRKFFLLILQILVLYLLCIRQNIRCCNYDYKWSLYCLCPQIFDVLESPLDCKEIQPVHPKDSNTLATCCKELTHWERPWCWERLRAEGEGDDRGWDGWMASSTQWTWVWVDSGSWWWTGRPGVLRFMGSQRVRYDWETELNWTARVYFWVFYLSHWCIFQFLCHCLTVLMTVAL